MHLGATLVTPHVSAAWQHAFDDVTPGVALAFGSTGFGLGIEGVPLTQDTALVGAGFDFALGRTPRPACLLPGSSGTVSATAPSRGG